MTLSQKMKDDGVVMTLTPYLSRKIILFLPDAAFDKVLALICVQLTTDALREHYKNDNAFNKANTDKERSYFCNLANSSFFFLKKLPKQ